MAGDCGEGRVRHAGGVEGERDEQAVSEGSQVV